jgi:hypothetical protein
VTRFVYAQHTCCGAVSAASVVDGRNKTDRKDLGISILEWLEDGLVPHFHDTEKGDGPLPRLGRCTCGDPREGAPQ